MPCPSSHVRRGVDPEQFLSGWRAKALAFVEVASSISSDAIGSLSTFFDSKSKEKMRLLGSLRVTRASDAPTLLQPSSQNGSMSFGRTPQEKERNVSPKLESSGGFISAATSSMSSLMNSGDVTCDELPNMTKLLFPVVDFLMDNQERILFHLRALKVSALRKEFQGGLLLLSLSLSFSLVEGK